MRRVLSKAIRNAKPPMILVVPVLLVLSAMSLALGLVLPLVHFKKLYFFNETPSLIDIVVSLWGQGSGGLAVLIALFSIVFPVVKLCAIALEATAPAFASGKATWLSRLLPVLGKWSMMDVVLVALVIVAAKTSGMASAFTQPGLWFYAASAITTGVLQMTLRPH
ncbi:paraquat-inducible protein A [Shinella sedimenti]